MIGKVLGFEASENKERAKNGVWTGNYLVRPIKLVLVVSVDWLEENKEVSMFCSICGSKDRSMTASCKEHGRCHHILTETVDMKEVRKQAYLEVE